MTDVARQTLADAQGRPVLTYIRGVREGLPWAEKVEPTGDTDPVDHILTAMPGWAVTGTVELGERLVQRGARIARHAHTMRRDLKTDPPPPGWADHPITPGLRAVPCDRDPRDMLPAWLAAFPPGHPDHYDMSDDDALTKELAPLLAGNVIGPLLPCSTLAVDQDDHIVAGIFINDHRGTPWVGDLFREPGPAYAGLGGDLFRRAIGAAADDGLTEIVLVVSDSNPARRLYDKLGFQLVDTSLTVITPAG